MKAHLKVERQAVIIDKDSLVKYPSTFKLPTRRDSGGTYQKSNYTSSSSALWLDLFVKLTLSVLQWLKWIKQIKIFSVIYRISTNSPTIIRTSARPHVRTSARPHVRTSARPHVISAFRKRSVGDKHDPATIIVYRNYNLAAS